MELKDIAGRCFGLVAVVAAAGAIWWGPALGTRAAAPPLSVELGATALEVPQGGVAAVGLAVTSRGAPVALSVEPLTSVLRGSVRRPLLGSGGVVSISVAGDAPPGVYQVLVHARAGAEHVAVPVHLTVVTRASVRTTLRPGAQAAPQHGEEVFLEVNPFGRFTFVECRTGRPIAGAIAAALAAPMC